MRSGSLEPPDLQSSQHLQLAKAQILTAKIHENQERTYSIRVADIRRLSIDRFLHSHSRV